MTHALATCLRRPLRPLAVVTALDAQSPLRGGLLLLGNFDGLHVGHRALLKAARQLAGAAPLGLMSCEPHPKQFFGNQQAFRLATQQGKRHLLQSLDLDYLYQPRFDAAFAARSPEEFVAQILTRDLGVSAVMAGPDFRFGRGRAGDMAQLAALGRAYGFRVETFAEQRIAGQRVSSTQVRAAIHAGDLTGAAQLLGSSWQVEIVRDGAGRFAIDPALCRPPAGRYRLSAAQGDLRVTLDASGRLAPMLGLSSGLWQIGPAPAQNLSALVAAPRPRAMMTARAT